MNEAPTIHTARLTLRPYRLTDWERTALFFESDASRYVGGPLPREHTWHGFAGERSSSAMPGLTRNSWPSTTRPTT